MEYVSHLIRDSSLEAAPQSLTRPHGDEFSSLHRDAELKSNSHVSDGVISSTLKAIDGSLKALDTKMETGIQMMPHMSKQEAHAWSLSMNQMATANKMAWVATTSAASSVKSCVSQLLKNQ